MSILDDSSNGSNVRFWSSASVIDNIKTEVSIVHTFLRRPVGDDLWVPTGACAAALRLPTPPALCRDARSESVSLGCLPSPVDAGDPPVSKRLLETTRHDKDALQILKGA